MDIIGNTIIFKDHIVWLETDLWKENEPITIEYVQDIADSLSMDGDARTHGRELREMNNDGSWHIMIVRK